jgi:hypothetical protein
MFEVCVTRAGPGLSAALSETKDLFTELSIVIERLDIIWIRFMYLFQNIKHIPNKGYVITSLKSSPSFCQKHQALPRQGGI